MSVPNPSLLLTAEDYAALHTGQPAHLLKKYEKNFEAHNPNFSGAAAPHPSVLVRPPPTLTFYWVIIAGEKVGLCHNPG